jgi:hypothetical protein
VSDALDHGEEVRHGIEAQMALAKFAAGDDLCRQFVRRFSSVKSEVDALANAELATRMDQRLPHIRLAGKLLRQQHFDFPMQELRGCRVSWRNRLRPRAAAVSVKPRRQNTGVVDHQ